MGIGIYDQLRAVIRISGERQNDIARGAQIQASTLSRFVRGLSGLSSDAIDRLTEYLGVVIVGRDEWLRRDRAYQLMLQRSAKPKS